MAAEFADAQSLEGEVTAIIRNGARLDRHHKQIALARDLLESIGIDCDDAGRLETPERMIRALKELTMGLDDDPAMILAKCFAESADELIVVRNIPFVSVCEHHIMPFTGTATVGYLPLQGKVVGLSKIPRLVQCFARRPQIQERLTREIGEAMMRYLAPAFVGVVVRATHSCMKLRGIQSDGEMVTSCILPPTQRQSNVKEEFLRFA